MSRFRSAEPSSAVPPVADRQSAANEQRQIYGDWIITYDPPPIPIRTMDWTYVHKDYDGPEDNRCGAAGSVLECQRDIAEMDAERAEAVAAELLEALRPFALNPKAASLSGALAQVTREDLLRAAAAMAKAEGG